MTSLANLHTELTSSPHYMGSANVANNIMWLRDTRGHVIVDKTSKKEFVGVIVGRVDPQRLNCGPEGNHIKPEISPLAKAKFQLQLCQPFEAPFAQDFDKVIKNLESLQGQIAVSGDRRNMILSDMNSKLIRFTSNVFEQREQAIPRHGVYLADLENVDGRKEGEIPVMDAETEDWPIPAKHKDEFESIKHDFMACPLGVYRDKMFVEPADVNDALKGALVEIFFTIRHYYLRDKKFDTFQADIQQIKIIKPGGSIASSGFKRRNAREGPLDVMGVGLPPVGEKVDGRSEKRIRVTDEE